MAFNPQGGSGSDIYSISVLKSILLYPPLRAIKYGNIYNISIAKMHPMVPFQHLVSQTISDAKDSAAHS